jgi:hypothetical protein
MKTSRAKNLQLAGIELVLPTVLCMDGRQSRGARTTLTVGYATGYVDTIVAPLVAEWLSRQFHRRFAEHGRGAEGDLAAEAFYDKLASHFGRETPFLAAIVSPRDAAPGLGSDQTANSGAAKPRNGNHRHIRSGRHSDALSRFMSGAGLTRWTFDGAVHAFINPNTGAAQVAFEPLPGGIELMSSEDFASPGTKPSRRTNEAAAWYGFGVPVSDPADIVLMLRNEISASRHARAHARRAAHV